MYKFNGEYCRKDTPYNTRCQPFTKNQVFYQARFRFKIVLKSTLSVDFCKVKKNEILLKYPSILEAFLPYRQQQTRPILPKTAPKLLLAVVVKML